MSKLSKLLDLYKRGKKISKAVAVWPVLWVLCWELILHTINLCSRLLWIQIKAEKLLKTLLARSLVVKISPKDWAISLKDKI